MSITLAQLEQEAARRLGPYMSVFTDRQDPSTATSTSVMLPQLRSNIDVDSVTNLWMLRRGIDWQGNPVVVDIADRQRLVDSYDPSSGRVYADYPWGGIPVEGEILEFHHLDPHQELRPAVMAGLRRCFVPDNVQAQPTSAYGGIDLTAQFPWLTEGWQVWGVRYGWLAPWYSAPFDTYLSGGHLILSGTHGNMLPSAVWVDVWRPAGPVSAAAPTSDADHDNDPLDVDLDYATAAAHIEAWHLFPSRMVAGAAGGTQATQAMAAQEFTRQAILHGPTRPIEVGFQTVVRAGSRRGSWVNSPYPW